MNMSRAKGLSIVVKAMEHLYGVPFAQEYAKEMAQAILMGDELLKAHDKTLEKLLK